MSEFNFNSQVCTSKVQSERLLALGLKNETADMCWYKNNIYGDNEVPRAEPITKWTKGDIEKFIPAWSLHRLWELFPKRIRSFQKDYFLTHFDFDDFEKVGYYTVRDGEDVYSDSTINSLIAACSAGERTDIYDALILLLTYDCVRNHFNKEYLI